MPDGTAQRRTTEMAKRLESNGYGEYEWDGRPIVLRIGPAVIYIKLSDLSARLYVDTYRAGGEGDEPMDSALLALPGGPETGEEV